METAYICIGLYLAIVVTHALTRGLVPPVVVEKIVDRRVYVKSEGISPHHLQKCSEEALWENRYPGEDEYNRRRYQHEMRDNLIHNLWEAGLIYYREDERSGQCMDKEIHARMVIQVMPPDKLPPHQRF